MHQKCRSVSNLCLLCGLFVIFITISKSSQEKRVSNTSRISSASRVLVKPESAAIKFPDEVKQAPECSGESTYCTQAQNYPKDYLNSLFERGIISNNGLLGVDHVIENIAQRIDADEELPLCASRERIVYPVQGETESGDWFFIANTDKIRQGVRVEECLRRNISCIAIGNGVKTKCIQKYVYRQMIGLNGNIVQEMKFKIPSCCMCMVINGGKQERNNQKRGQIRKYKRFAPIDYSDDEFTEETDSRIYFPKPQPKLSSRSFLPPVPSTFLTPPPPACAKGGTVCTTLTPPPPPACAKGGTFCTTVPNYPIRLLQRLVAANKLKKIAIFGEIDPPVDDFIATRFNQNFEVPLCDARMEKVFPVVAKSKENTWEYIVQYGDDTQQFMQAVHLDICHKPESPCKFQDSFPSTYRTQCKQKYIYRQLLAISHQTGETYTSHFQLPSCCVCQVASEPFGLTRKRRRK